ncbi:MarR family transcriptional regulator [Ignavibacterium sp.]|uniref:MarR family transcriptional regulator n=1 Tax=Ignavibacterium sp. TaxID=2651167 RepID=UPI00307E4563
MPDNSLQFPLGFIILCQIFKNTCKQLKKHFNISENVTILFITIYTDIPHAIKHFTKKLSISAALTSKILPSLELKGLITRMLSDQDKRSEKVLLTEKGIKVTCHIIEFFKVTVCEKILNVFNSGQVHLKIFADTIKMEVSNHNSLVKPILNN